MTGNRQIFIISKCKTFIVNFKIQNTKRCILGSVLKYHAVSTLLHYMVLLLKVDTTYVFTCK